MADEFDLPFVFNYVNQDKEEEDLLFFYKKIFNKLENIIVSTKKLKLFFQKDLIAMEQE